MDRLSTTVDLGDWNGNRRTFDRAALTNGVRAVLHRLFEGIEFDGRDELVAQIDLARISGGSLRAVWLAAAEPVQGIPSGLLPCRAVLRGPANLQAGEIGASARDGRLNRLLLTPWVSPIPPDFPYPPEPARMDPSVLRVTPAPADRVELELSDSERMFLERGLIAWFGPASPSEELAEALGFDGVDDFRACARSLEESVQQGLALTPREWTQVLSSAEVAFSSRMLGAAFDWGTVTGLGDVQSFHLMRQLQQKFASQGVLTVIGTRQPRGPHRLA